MIARWFDARFDILVYDLPSTCFESDPPFDERRQFGYSRDSRPDCVQVVIALIVTPGGFPLACEVMPGNTSDQSTLAGFLERVERQYGRSDRICIMDRGIPTEETLQRMREGDAPARNLVGTPTGRRADPARHHRGARHDPDCGRASAHDRRPAPCPAALHPPRKELELLLHQLGMTLPEQGAPRLSS